MAALLQAPVSLQFGLRASRRFQDERSDLTSSAASSGFSVQTQHITRSHTLGRASSSLYAESFFGSRQLLPGSKYAGLRKEFAPGSAASKREKRRLSRQFWWQLSKGTIEAPAFPAVRAGLSAVPEGNLGLYDPAFDKDACGVGFVADLSAKPSRQTVSESRHFPFIFILVFSLNSNHLAQFMSLLQCSTAELELAMLKSNYDVISDPTETWYSWARYISVQLLVTACSVCTIGTIRPPECSLILGTIKPDLFVYKTREVGNSPAAIL